MELMTVKEVATALRVHARVVRGMYRRGELKGLKPGRDIRIYRSCVEDLLNGVVK